MKACSIETRLVRVDPKPLRGAFLVAPPADLAAKLAQAGPDNSAAEAKRLALSIIRSREFQQNLIGFVTDALPKTAPIVRAHP